MAFTKSWSIDSRNEHQHVKWLMKQTKLTSEISCPTDSCLAQLVRHWPEDPEVLGFNPHWGQFLTIFFFFFFCSFLCKDLSDNLTETPIVKNSIETQQDKTLCCAYDTINTKYRHWTIAAILQNLQSSPWQYLRLKVFHSHNCSRMNCTCSRCICCCCNCCCCQGCCHRYCFGGLNDFLNLIRHV